MAWTINPIDTVANLPGTDGFQDWAIFEELIAAYVERAKAAQDVNGYGGAADFDLYNPWGATSGVNIGDASAIATFQQDVLDLVDASGPEATSHMWLDVDQYSSLTGLNIRSDGRPTSYSDSNSLVWSTSDTDTNDIIDSLSIGRSGANIFTRKYGTPASITTGYGVCQAGDYIGIYKEGTNKVAPLWNELYLILDSLRYLITGGNIADSDREQKIAAESKVNALRADAITNLKATWDTKSFVTISDNRAGLVECNITHGPNYGGQLQRYRYKAEISNCPTETASVCEYFVYGRDTDHSSFPMDEWDDNTFDTEQDGLGMIHAFASESGGTRTTPFMLDDGGYPVITSADTGRRGLVVGDQGFLGISVATDYALFKLNFDKIS